MKIKFTFFLLISLATVKSFELTWYIMQSQRRICVKSQVTLSSLKGKMLDVKYNLQGKYFQYKYCWNYTVAMQQ